MKRGTWVFLTVTAATLFASASVVRAEQPKALSEELVKANKLFDEGTYDAAAPLLYQVFRGQAGDSIANRQAAGLRLAKILTDRGAYIAARDVADESLVGAKSVTPATIRLLGRLSSRVHYKTIGRLVNRFAAQVAAEAKRLPQDDLLLAGILATNSSSTKEGLMLLAAMTANAKQRPFARAHLTLRLVIAKNLAEADKLIAAERQVDGARADQLAYNAALLSRVINPDKASVRAAVRKLTGVNAATASVIAFWLAVTDERAAKKWNTRPSLAVLHRVAYLDYCGPKRNDEDVFGEFRTSHVGLVKEIDAVAASLTTTQSIASADAGKLGPTAGAAARFLVMRALRDYQVGPLANYVALLEAYKAKPPVITGRELGVFVSKALAKELAARKTQLDKLVAGALGSLKQHIGRLSADIMAGKKIPASALGLSRGGCVGTAPVVLDGPQFPLSGLTPPTAQPTGPKTPVAPTKKKAGGCAGCAAPSGSGTAWPLIIVGLLLLRRRQG